MPTAIQFYDQFCSETVEIYNIIINTLLSLETDGVFIQKAIP